MPHPLVNHGLRRHISTRNADQFLSLNHFLQRQRALSLYRAIIRAVHKIPQSSARDEMRRFVRGEFERNRNVTDLGHIRYLISTGKTEFDTMKRYIEEQAR